MTTLLRPLRRPIFEQQSSCLRCLHHLSRVRARDRQAQNLRSLRFASNESAATSKATWQPHHFSFNTAPAGTGAARIGHVLTITRQDKSRDPQGASRTVASEIPSAPLASNEPLAVPRRRRKRPRDAQTDSETFLPSNSASTFSSISSASPATSFRRLFTSCLALSKPRLSFLIVLTTATAYSLYPMPSLFLEAANVTPLLSALTMVFLTGGTALCSASANAFNMLMEPKFDAQMSRTRNRPLVRGLISRRNAIIFAILTGGLGVGALYFGVNPTVSFLGGLNIFLYAGVYTPLKRISVVNTWVGAVVGGIPPLMGWAAAAEQTAVGDGGWQELLLGEGSIGGWLLAGLLYAWQFPHFNSLSWPIREEYKLAGYRMLAWVNPKMNGRVALRYAGLCFPLCFGLWWCGITDQGFLVTSSLANAWMVRQAWAFWKKEGHKGSARGLFWASVWHLPAVLGLAMLHKAGLWQSLWDRAMSKDTEHDQATDDS